MSTDSFVFNSHYHLNIDCKCSFFQPKLVANIFVLIFRCQTMCFWRKVSNLVCWKKKILNCLSFYLKMGTGAMLWPTGSVFLVHFLTLLRKNFLHLVGCSIKWIQLQVKTVNISRGVLTLKDKFVVFLLTFLFLY